MEDKKNTIWCFQISLNLKYKTYINHGVVFQSTFRYFIQFNTSADFQIYLEPQYLMPQNTRG